MSYFTRLVPGTSRAEHHVAFHSVDLFLYHISQYLEIPPTVPGRANAHLLRCRPYPPGIVFYILFPTSYFTIWFNFTHYFLPDRAHLLLL